MKSVAKRGGLIFLLVGLVLPLKAEVKVTVQVRHRMEYANKDFNSDTKGDIFHLLRTRLGVKLIEDKFVAYLQIQDSRTFGEEASTLSGRAPNADFHQAYLLVKDFFNLPLDLKVGRMEVAYGEQRLIGAVGWHNVGRSFDGILAKFKGKASWVDVFDLRVHETRAAGDRGDHDLFGLYGNFVSAAAKFQPYFLYELKQPSDTLSRLTTGILVKGNLSGFKPTLEIAYQGGKQNGLKVSAFMATFNVAYSFKNASLKPKFMLGVDFLSGDDDLTDSTVKVFNTLYATNHKFYGFMDYFLNIPTHTYKLGLTDIFARFGFVPLQKAWLCVTYHKFNSSADYEYVENGETKKTKDFAQEIDLILKYKYSKRFGIVGGGGIAIPGKIFKDKKGEDTSTWFFLMSTMNL